MVSEIISKMKKTLNINESIIELADFGAFTDAAFNMVKTMENLTLDLSNECALAVDEDSISDNDGALLNDIKRKAVLTCDNGVITIILPLALPSRNKDAKKYSFTYYRNTYYKLLQPLLMGYYRYEDAVDIKIIQMAPANKLRDYDDMEPKMLIDALASFLLKDDSPMYYDLSFSYEISNNIGTKIEIRHKEKHFN